MMRVEMSRAWQTLIQVVSESNKESYTAKEILGLMTRILREECDNLFMAQLGEVDFKKLYIELEEV